ncbi:MAG TPA: cob(I)yrinic acid a,c-diamide adenosyltransferase [Luteibaculaceae bacterium]|nr:cob(I)yrinic acid a,c-diamide adenosyltransferase [Luteibaculaceae bacterium]
MKIYTRKGDTGETSLIGGVRVGKDSLRIDSYGTIDELNAFIGLLRDHLADNHEIKVLIEIQDRLFTLGSLLAEAPGGSRMELPQIKQSDIDFLELEIDRMDEKLPPMKNFVLPGGHQQVSLAHVCRTVCRRAERLVVHLGREYTINPIIPMYLNRLSDYLFVLSRKLAADHQVVETPWKPRM